VGRAQSELVLGKHSGKHGLTKRCEALGYSLTEEEVAHLYEKFIALADKKKEVFEDDLRVLIASIKNEAFETYHLDQVRTSGSDPTMALVRLRRGASDLIEMATGDGPVDAACNAVDRIVGISGKLMEFSLRAATPGKDAMGEAHVTVGFESLACNGTGASTDIIEAAVMAYVNAVNKCLAVRNT